MSATYWYCNGTVLVALLQSQQAGTICRGGPMTLSNYLQQLDESSDQPLYQQLQTSAARRHREAGHRARRRPAAGAGSRGRCSPSRASPCARPSTGSSTKACWCAARARALSCAARVEKNFAKLTSFSEDMRARGRKPRSVWMNRAAGTVTPEESLTLRLVAGHAGVPLPSHALRRRRAHGARIRHGAVVAACRRSKPWRPRCTKRSRSPGNRPVRALQRLRAVLLTAEQAKLLKAHERDAGLARRARGLPRGRPRRRVLAVLLPRRHLRLRRRAQRPGVNDATPHVLRGRRGARRRRRATRGRMARRWRRSGVAAARRARRAPSSPARAAAPIMPRRSRSTSSKRTRACSPPPPRRR